MRAVHGARLRRALKPRAGKDCDITIRIACLKRVVDDLDLWIERQRRRLARGLKFAAAFDLPLGAPAKFAFAPRAFNPGDTS